MGYIGAMWNIIGFGIMICLAVMMGAATTEPATSPAYAQGISPQNRTRSEIKLIYNSAKAGVKSPSGAEPH